jgi:hypothetical protein
METIIFILQIYATGAILSLIVFRALDHYNFEEDSDDHFTDSALSAALWFLSIPIYFFILLDNLLKHIVLKLKK